MLIIDFTVAVVVVLIAAPGDSPVTGLVVIFIVDIKVALLFIFEVIGFDYVILDLRKLILLGL